MKKIDKLLLKAFVGPFIVTFFISLFVFIMQFFWKYIDDLVGKGLELSVIAELTFYLSATIVPMVIPLAILLASIITFGNLGEHYELVALKSAGISLHRFVLPLFFVILLLSGATFYFSNNILPKATLKFNTLLYSVVKKRPAVNIKENVFYDGLEGYVIKIGEKGEDNITLHDVYIWDKTGGRTGDNLLVANKGEMFSTPNDSFLVFRLYDGWKYEDLKPTPEKKKNYEHIRTAFKELELVMDISNINFEKKDEKLFTKNPKTMAIAQLQEALDSIKSDRKKIPKDFLARVKNLNHMPDSIKPKEQDSMLLAMSDEPLLSILAPSKSEHNKILKKAQDNISSMKSYSKWENDQIDNNTRRNSRFHIYLYYKFALAFSCIVLFLIGAPLGAIIRKGGLGLPMVMSIIFFLIYHVLSTLGRKLAEELIVAPFHGVWLAIYILFPLAIFLTIKASNDSALFNSEMYWKYFGRFFDWIVKRFKPKKAV